MSKLNKMLHTKAEVVKTDGQRDGVIEAVVGSSNCVDRMGEVIDQAGWDLTNYQTNPVILWGHNVREERPPIGKALKVWIQGAQNRTKKLMFTVQFDLQDTFAAEIYRKVKDGFVNTVSVGFMPLEREDNTYTKAELLELSFVPVPANPEALVQLRSAGLEPMELKDMFPAVKEEPVPDEKVEEKEDEKSDETTEESETEEKTEESVDEKVEEEGKEETETETEEKEETEETETEDEKSEEGSEEEAKEEGAEEETEEDESEKAQVTAHTTMKNHYHEHAGVKAGEGHSHTHMHTEGNTSHDPHKKQEAIDEMVTKGVIPFKDLGKAPETDAWDAGAEMKGQTPEVLKLMSAWYDESAPESRSSYKLPHHKGDGGHVAVWRGVAAAMAALLGARGGVAIPEADKKGVYNHLVKHYKQFSKTPPEFRAVENQVLKGYEEEIHALTLDREDRYEVRLIKKVLEALKKKEVKLEAVKVRVSPSVAEVQMAMEVLNVALSQAMKSSKEGGDK